MSGVASSHHVLGIEHLLGQLWYSQSSVLLRSTSSERSKTWHEEVQAREWHHIDSKLSQVGIKLTRKPKRSGHPRHCERNQMIQISICGIRKLQGPERRDINISS